MKYYKIRLQDKVKGPMNYPGGIPQYEAEIGNHALDHLYYHDENELCHLLLAIPDEITGVVRDGVEEVTEAEALALSNQHEPKVEKVTDPVKIQRLTLKATAGIGFTPDELKALDPNDSTPGFGYEKTFADRTVELKEKKRK